MPGTQLKHLVDDSLGLAKNRSAQAMLAKEGNNEPNPEVVYFSDLLVKINKRNREQLRALLITDKAIYNLTTDFTKCKRRIPLEEVFSISVSRISHEFVVHVPSEYDYRFKSSKKVTIAELINELIKRRTDGRETKTLFRENNVLRNYQQTKRRKGKVPNRSLARRFSLFAEKGDDLFKGATDAAAAAGFQNPSSQQLGVSGPTSPEHSPNHSSSHDRGDGTHAAAMHRPSFSLHATSDGRDSSTRHPKFDVPRFHERCSQLVKPSHGVQDIWTVFQKIRLLGEGSYAKVFLVSYLNHPDRGRFALKQMRKTDEFEQNMFEREVSILSHLRHAGICRFYECFECPVNFYLLQRACLGGELFDKVASQGGIQEPQSAMILAEVLQIIAHLHDNGVAHRDIKLENLMYTSRDAAARLQLIDFGFARRVDPRKQYDEIVGALMYLSPELVESARNVANPIKGTVLLPSDMWAFGSLTYVVITGTHAFASDGEADESFDKILECSPPYDKVEMTDDAEDFVRKLLVVDPEERLTAKQALDHPWIKPHLKPIAIRHAAQASKANGRPVSPTTPSASRNGRRAAEKEYALDDVDQCRVNGSTSSSSRPRDRRRSSHANNERSPSFCSSGSFSSQQGGANGSMAAPSSRKGTSGGASQRIDAGDYSMSCEKLFRILRQMAGDDEDAEAIDEDEFKQSGGGGRMSAASVATSGDGYDSETASPSLSPSNARRRFDLTKLVAAIEEEWKSLRTELHDLREKLEDQTEQAEELQEQQLSMIQDRQRAQLELANQMQELQKKVSDANLADLINGTSSSNGGGLSPGTVRVRGTSRSRDGVSKESGGGDGAKTVPKKKKKHIRTSTLGRFTLGRTKKKKKKDKRKNLQDFDFSDPKK